jgi:hypothetical protein
MLKPIVKDEYIALLPHAATSPITTRTHSYLISNPLLTPKPFRKHQNVTLMNNNRESGAKRCKQENPKSKGILLGKKDI